jgi:NAD(P)-dependent dehydrogenase (short-subunit alcohol dehydrogenase family)
MRARRSGVIALIGSMAGRGGAPGVGLYCATKFALEGLAEALRDEVAPLGIAVTIIEPGYFRTALLNQGTNTFIAAKQIADYDKTPAAAAIAHHAAVDGKQAGDPVKGAQRIVDVLTLSGSAKGRSQVPVRLALGQDAYEGIKAKCESQLKELEEWKDLSLGTEHDDVTQQ